MLRSDHRDLISGGCCKIGERNYNSSFKICDKLTVDVKHANALQDYFFKIKQDKRDIMY